MYHRKASLTVLFFLFVLFVPVKVFAVTYKLGHSLYIGWSTYTVADVKGFWREAGVDVKVYQYQSSLAFVKAFTYERMDLSAMPLTTIAYIRNLGQKFVFLGACDLADGVVTIILKKELLNKNLKGITVGMFAEETNTKFRLSKYLKTRGVNLSDVRLVHMSSSELAANFIAGRLNMVVMWGYQKERAIVEGDGVVVDKNYIYPYGLMANEETIDRIPQSDLKKIFQGWLKAVEWMNDPDNWDEYKMIVNRHFYTLQPDFSDEEIRRRLKTVRLLKPDQLLHYNLVELPAFFEEAKNIFINEKMIRKDVLNTFTFDNIVKNSTLINVLREQSNATPLAIRK